MQRNFHAHVRRSQIVSPQNSPAASNPIGELNGAPPQPNGLFISRGMALKFIVGRAYGKFSFQILGGPAWFDSDGYDIEAKPDSITEQQLEKLSWEQRDEVQSRMLRTLLEDRLKLKVHEETRQLPIFALIVAKNGSKLHETKAENTDSAGSKRFGSGLTVSNGKIIAKGVSMDELAAQLTGTGNIDHNVLNKTGLTGVYDFTLQYSDDESTISDSSPPSIFTAIQEQLGLKIESTKGPVKVLVIDHVERPSAN